MRPLLEAILSKVRGQPGGSGAELSPSPEATSEMLLPLPVVQRQIVNNENYA
jgi:hypothetical protein